MYLCLGEHMEIFKFAFSILFALFMKTNGLEKGPNFTKSKDQKEEILPPCQACKNVVNSFAKVKVFNELIIFTFFHLSKLKLNPPRLLVILGIIELIVGMLVFHLVL